MKNFARIFTVVLVSGLSFAHAQDLTGRIGLGLGAGMSFPTGPKFFSDVNDSSYAGALWGRYHFGSKAGLELAYDRVDFKNTAAKSDIASLSYFYRFGGVNDFSWIAQLGLGAGKTPGYGRGTEGTWQFTAKAKLGAEYMTSSHISWGAGVTFDHLSKTSKTDKELNVFVPGISMTYYFGSSDQVAPVPTGPESTGSRDDDNDGINNDNDRCLNTAPGVKVGGYGCAEDEKVSIKLEVRFASKKTELDPMFDESLKDLAKFMGQFTDTAVEIAGHTDSTGNAKNNLALSQMRADAVKSYLVNKLGVDASRLTAKGYGTSQPVDDNRTKEGRAKNRRVMAEVSAVKKAVN